MAARQALAPKSPQKLQRELEDLQLVLKARNGSRRHSTSSCAATTASSGSRRARTSSPAGTPTTVQGGMISSRRSATSGLGQGDLVPVVRRALRHSPDHHRDQVRDALQARPAEHVRLLQSHARVRLRRRARRRRAARAAGRRPVGARDLDRGAPCPRRLPRDDPVRSSRRRSACTSTATRTSRWPRSSTATARRSTTPCSASLEDPRPPGDARRFPPERAGAPRRGVGSPRPTCGSTNAVEQIVEYREGLPVRVTPVSGRADVRRALGELRDGPTGLDEVMDEPPRRHRPA